MNADTLLSITEPEHLFPGDEGEAKSLYRELSKKWHPDVPSGDVKIFSHISGLYQERTKLLSNGNWKGAQDLHLGAHRIEVLRGHQTTFGMGYISRDQVWYTYQSDHAEFWERARKAPKLFKFANEKMKKEMIRFLPELQMEGFADDGRRFIALSKSSDLIRLRDAVEFLNGFEARHTAWVVSGLLNIACYLRYSNIVHQNLSQDTVFISPEHHSVVVLGGWEYVAARGTRISIVPVQTFEVMSFRAKTLKIASSLTDLECIKRIGRELAKYDSTPKVIRDWLGRVSDSPTVDQYTEWMETLKQAYGPRRFVHLKLSAEDVYSSGLVQRK
jgi:hypothetical protein